MASKHIILCPKHDKEITHYCKKAGQFLCEKCNQLRAKKSMKQGQSIEQLVFWLDSNQATQQPTQQQPPRQPEQDHSTQLLAQLQEIKLRNDELVKHLDGQLNYLQKQKLASFTQELQMRLQYVYDHFGHLKTDSASQGGSSSSSSSQSSRAQSSTGSTDHCTDEQRIVGNERGPTQKGFICRWLSALFSFCIWLIILTCLYIVIIGTAEQVTGRTEEQLIQALYGYDHENGVHTLLGGKIQVKFHMEESDDETSGLVRLTYVKEEIFEPNIDYHGYTYTDLQNITAEQLDKQSNDILRSELLNYKQAIDVMQFLPEASILKQIYKGTIHGFSAKTFHEHCDDKGATLLIVRSALKPREFFGAYTDIPWSSGERKWEQPISAQSQHNSFVFTQGYDGVLVKLQSVKGSEVGHYSRNSGIVVSFENAFFLADNCDKNWYSQTMLHENQAINYRVPSNMTDTDLKLLLAGGVYFKCDEVEVYQVEKLAVAST